MTTDPNERNVPLGVPMFGGLPMADFFYRMAELTPSTAMAPSSRPVDWEEGEPAALPVSYEFAGRARRTEDLLRDTDTAALLVLQDGRVRYERYERTGGPDVAWITMSVAQSVVSALVGLAHDQGHIGRLDEPISDYIDVEPGSAYDGVSIRNVLRMSSGARWDDDYSNPDSDVYRLSAAFLGIGSFDDFVASAVRDSPPGTVCRHNPTDTQALATLVAHATGRSMADFMRTELIEPLGTTSTCHWLVDRVGREAASFGLTMTARDLARFGELYRTGGSWRGRQLLPADYVAESLRVAEEHQRPGRVHVAGRPWELGMGHQWWLPEIDEGEFAAIGNYNQFVYVHQPSRAVIVKLSANHTYGTSNDERTNRDHEHVAFLRTIARSL